MKKLFKWFSYFKKMGNLSIEEIFFQNNVLLCKVKDFVTPNPFVVSAQDILTNESLMSRFKPRDLLKLQEIFNQASLNPPIQLIETLINQNKYFISFHGRKFHMTGRDICSDLQLLKDMDIKSAFKIIYETGYYDAQQNYLSLEKEKQTTIQNSDYSNIIDFSTESKKIKNISSK